MQKVRRRDAIIKKYGVSKSSEKNIKWVKLKAESKQSCSCHQPLNSERYKN